MTLPFRDVLVRVLERIRIKRDAEGFDYAPARYGRLEDRGLALDGQRRLWAFTDRPVMIRRLRAIPGVTLTQVGDREAAGWLRADDEVALRAVAALLKVRMRRPPTPGRSAEAMAELTIRRNTLRASRQGQEGPRTPPDIPGYDSTHPDASTPRL